jgi:hypothetical protein
MRDEHQHQHHKNLSDILSQLIVLLEKQELEQALVEKQHTPHQDLVQSLVKKEKCYSITTKSSTITSGRCRFYFRTLTIKST